MTRGIRSPLLSSASLAPRRLSRVPEPYILTRTCVEDEPRIAAAVRKTAESFLNLIVDSVIYGLVPLAAHAMTEQMSRCVISPTRPYQIVSPSGMAPGLDRGVICTGDDRTTAFARLELEGATKRSRISESSFFPLAAMPRMAPPRAGRAGHLRCACLQVMPQGCA